jgi:hypothetical protein
MKTTSITPIFARIVLAFVLGLVAGAAIACAQIVFWQSRYRFYDSIEIGMSREQVQRALSREKLRCGIEPWLRTSSDCWLHDPWRTYLIKFDPKTHTVSGKFYGFNWYPFESKPYALRESAASADPNRDR